MHPPNPERLKRPLPPQPAIPIRPAAAAILPGAVPVPSPAVASALSTGGDRRGIAGEDGAVQILQPGARLDTQLLGQGGPQRSERLQRPRLPLAPNAAHRPARRAGPAADRIRSAPPPPPCSAPAAVARRSAPTPPRPRPQAPARATTPAPPGTAVPQPPDHRRRATLGRVPAGLRSGRHQAAPAPPAADNRAQMSPASAHRQRIGQPAPRSADAAAAPATAGFYAPIVATPAPKPVRSADQSAPSA